MVYGVPDECLGDFDLDGDRSTARRDPCNSRADLDGDVDLADLILFQAGFSGSR